VISFIRSFVQISPACRWLLLLFFWDVPVGLDLSRRAGGDDWERRGLQGLRGRWAVAVGGCRRNEGLSGSRDLVCSTGASKHHLGLPNPSRKLKASHHLTAPGPQNITPQLYAARQAPLTLSRPATLADLILILPLRQSLFPAFCCSEVQRTDTRLELVLLEIRFGISRCH
jgi:hypothetical protein